MSDADDCRSVLKGLGLGLGFFGGVVVAPQVTAMYTNENAYKFYTDTAIGKIPNIVTTTVGALFLIVLISMWVVAEAQEREKEERAIAKDKVTIDKTTDEFIAEKQKQELARTPTSTPKVTNNVSNPVISGRGSPTTNLQMGTNTNDGDDTLSNILAITAITVAMSPPRSRSPSADPNPNNDNDRESDVDTGGDNNDNNSGGGGDYDGPSD